MELFSKRGTKVGYHLIKVTQMKNDQYRVTIPRDIAIELGLKGGDVVHFELERKVIPMLGGDNKTEKYCIMKKTKV